MEKYRNFTEEIHIDLMVMILKMEEGEIVKDSS
jgi:hypothetical protein